MTVFIIFFLCLFLISYIQKKQKRGDDVSTFFPMTTWLALAPACIATVVFANGALDRSPVEPHPTVVMQKLVRRGKSTSYYLQTSSWRPNHSVEKLQVSYRVYTQFQINDPIIVEVHRGALYPMARCHPQKTVTLTTCPATLADFPVKAEMQVSLPTAE